MASRRRGEDVGRAGIPFPAGEGGGGGFRGARDSRASRTRRAMDRGGDAKGRTRRFANLPRGVASSIVSDGTRTRARRVSRAREVSTQNARPRGRSRESIFARGCDSKSVEDSALVRGRGKAARGVRDDARATRVRPFGVRLSERGWPPPRDVRAAISRFFTTRVAAFIREDERDVRQVQVCQVQDGDRNHSFSSRFGRVGVSRGARGGARGERSRRV